MCPCYFCCCFGICSHNSYDKMIMLWPNWWRGQANISTNVNWSQIVYCCLWICWLMEQQVRPRLDNGVLQWSILFRLSFIMNQNILAMCTYICNYTLLLGSWLEHQKTTLHTRSTSKMNRPFAATLTLATLWLAAVSCEVFLRPSLSWVIKSS